jgi:hypothetical protein
MFYDSRQIEESIVRETAYKLLEVLILKNESKIKNPKFTMSQNAINSYENTFPIVFEDVSKKLFTG